MATLVQQNDVALAGQEGKGNQVLKLTAKGQRTLTQALTIIPESKTFPLHFDGIIRTAELVRGTLLKFRDLRAHGLKEMPVIPNRRPDVSEFPLARLQEILRLGEATGDKRELLSVKRIERATRLFRPGVALLFRALDDSASVVDFIVDDKLRPDYAEAIDRNGGPPAFGLGEEPAMPEAASTEVLFDAPSSDAASETPETDNRQRVRRSHIYEHPGILDDAISKCETRLLIGSPWVGAEVVNSEFFEKLKTALRRNVKVYIAYGHSERLAEKESIRAGRIAEENLQRLTLQFENLTLHRWNTYSSLLLLDSTLMVTGNFNWLSFREPERRFREVRSTLVEIPEQIDHTFMEQMKRFGLQL